MYPKSIISLKNTKSTVDLGSYISKFIIFKNLLIKFNYLLFKANGEWSLDCNLLQIYFNLNIN